jgi:hypothetical protein
MPSAKGIRRGDEMTIQLAASSPIHVEPVRHVASR